MKKIYLLLFVSILSIGSYGQLQELWSSQFHISNDIPDFLSKDSDDNLYVLGRVNQGVQPTRMAVVKYNSKGEELWNSIYVPDTESLAVTPRAFVVDGAGAAIAVGHITINQTDILIAKYSPQGTLLWDYIFNYEVQNGHDNAHFATTDEENNIYICGASINTSGHYSMLILKLSPQGELLLNIRKEWSSNGANRAIHMAVDGAGNMIVTGRRNGPQAGHYVVYKLDPDGDTLWTDTYEVSNTTGSEGQQVLIGSNDNIYVSAHFGTFYGIQAYSPQGQLLWREIWQEAGMNSYFSRDMAFDHEGNIIVLGDGILTGSNRNRDWFIQKYLPSGERMWSVYINGSANGADEARSLAINDQGKIWAYGYLRYASGVQNFPFPTIVEIDTNGAETWRINVSDDTVVTTQMVLLNSGVAIINYGATVFGQSGNFFTKAFHNDDLSFSGANDPLFDFLLYPNPSNNVVYIRFETHRIDFQQNSLFKIIDMTGRTVFQSKNSIPQYIDVSQWSRGLYLFTLKTNDRMINRKLLVE